MRSVLEGATWLCTCKVDWRRKLFGTITIVLTKKRKKEKNGRESLVTSGGTTATCRVVSAERGPALRWPGSPFPFPCFGLRGVGKEGVKEHAFANPDVRWNTREETRSPV